MLYLIKDTGQKVVHHTRWTSLFNDFLNISRVGANCLPVKSERFLEYSLIYYLHFCIYIECNIHSLMFQLFWNIKMHIQASIHCLFLPFLGLKYNFKENKLTRKWTHTER